MPLEPASSAVAEADLFLEDDPEAEAAALVRERVVIVEYRLVGL